MDGLRNALIASLTSPKRKHVYPFLTLWGMLTPHLENRTLGKPSFRRNN